MREHNLASPLDLSLASKDRRKRRMPAADQNLYPQLRQTGAARKGFAQLRCPRDNRDDIGAWLVRLPEVDSGIDWRACCVNEKAAGATAFAA